MSELLERIHGEIRERLEVSRAAVEEYRILEATLEALGGPLTGPTRTASTAEPPQPKRRARSEHRSPKPTRAPRGANRAAVLAVLAERPGVSANELSNASGVKRPVLYALL